MNVNHERNYRLSLPLGIVFALTSVAAAVIFVVYASEWADDPVSTRDADDYLRATYAYNATVISLLLLIVFFNGYHLTKMSLQ
tara:strand:+ start:4516 stop:4764 length:249 start_codon:yes stop_codon:yes gene_type:complete